MKHPEQSEGALTADETYSILIDTAPSVMATVVRTRCQIVVTACVGGARETIIVWQAGKTIKARTGSRRNPVFVDVPNNQKPVGMREIVSTRATLDAIISAWRDERSASIVPDAVLLS